MHLLLTDQLTCPRCGPEFGLILLADRLVERRVHAGSLGCPNCRDAFPVVDGFADLRAPPRGDLPEGLLADAEADAEAVDRLRALLGLVRGPGRAVLMGAPAAAAEGLAEAVEELDVVAIDPDLHDRDDVAGVSRMIAAPGLPFYGRRMRGVALDGRLGRAWFSEGVRVLAPKCRIVVRPAPEWVADAAVEEGLTVLVSEAETIVAARG